MKKLMLILIIIICYSSFSQDNSEYLVAYWSFNDSTANDNSGNNHHGTIHNDVTPTEGVDGKSAFYFRGQPGDVSTGGHILIPYIDFPSMSEFTISMWVNENDFSTDWGECYIWFGDFNYGYLGIDHCWPLPEKITFVHFAVGSGISISPKPINITYDFKNYRNRWIHYCLVYKNNTIYGYIDGKLVGQKQQDVLIYDNHAGIARHWWKYEGQDRTSTRFIGSIDEVRIFRKALTKKEILKEYLLGKHFDICNNESATLKAPDGYQSYTWSTGEKTQSIIVSKPGSYTVTVVTDENDTVTSQPYTVNSLLGATKPPDNLSFEFISLNLSNKSVTFVNPLNESIKIASIKLKGISGGVFKLKDVNYPVNLEAGASLKIELDFKPWKLNEYIDSVMIEIENPCHIVLMSQVKAIPNLCDELGFEYNNFADDTGLFFVNKSARKDNFIRLTNNLINQRGAVWYRKCLPLRKGFVTQFGFRMSQGSNSNAEDNSEPGADGIVFVIQNHSISSIGIFGGNLGYNNIPNSIAFEIDLFANDNTQIESLNDPNGNHVAIQSKGSKPNSAMHEAPYTLGINSNILNLKSDGTVYHGKIEYNLEPNTLKFYIDSTENFTSPVLTLSSFQLEKYINFEQDEWAVAGFTSATGNASQNHDLMYWNFCPFKTDAQFLSDVAEDNFTNQGSNPFQISSRNGSVEFLFQDNPNPAEPIVKVYNIIGSIVYCSSGTGYSVSLPLGLYIYNVTIGQDTFNGKFLVY